MNTSNSKVLIVDFYLIPSLKIKSCSNIMRFLFILFFIITQVTFGQNNISELTQKLKTVESAHKLKLLDSIFSLMSKENHPELFSQFKETLSVVKELDSEDLLVRSLENGFFHIQLGKTGIPLDFISEYAEDLLKNPEGISKKINVGRLHFLYGKTLFYLQKPIDSSIAQIEKSIEIYKALALQDDDKYGQMVYFISAIYLEKGNTVASLKYAREATRVYEKKGSTVIYSIKSIEANLLSSIRLFSEAKALRDDTYKKALKDKHYFAIANLKYSQVSDYILQGKDDEIVACLLSGMPYPNELEKKYPRMASVMYKLLTVYSAKEGNLKDAEKYLTKVHQIPYAGMKDESYFFAKSNYHLVKEELDSALFYAEKNLSYLKDRDPNHYLYEARYLTSSIYQQKRDYKKALYHQEKALKLKDSLSLTSGAKTATYYKTLYETEKKEKKIQQLESEKALSESKRNTLLGILLSVVLIFFVIWYRGRMRRKQLALEIAHNKKELNQFTQQLIQKSGEQELLKEQLEKLKVENREEESISVIGDLVASKILTKDDWYQFKEKFVKVYPNFFIKIQNDGYQLTKSEERLVALEKLELDNYEIAKMLGISTDTVFVSRYRLRKKINAPKEISLVDYFEKAS